MSKVCRDYQHKSWSEGLSGLHQMCDFGAAKHREEGWIPRFELFNKDEMDSVDTYMREEHPGVPYQISRVC